MTPVGEAATDAGKRGADEGRPTPPGAPPPPTGVGARTARLHPRLATAVGSVLVSTAHVRTEWLRDRAAVTQDERLLLELEHSAVELLSAAVDLVNTAIDADADGQGHGHGLGPEHGHRDGDGQAAVAHDEWIDLMLAATRLEREAAHRDREVAAFMYHQAGLERAAALADRNRAALHRHQAALERAAAMTDDVTGALVRRHGRVALQHEIDRCRRGDGRLVMGFIDVDGLKRVNDANGHAAGDALLREAVSCLRASLRSYDVIVRYGGDEFVYSLAGATLSAAPSRSARMAALLAERTGGATVSVGLAELRPDDTLDSILRRADADLYRQRQRTPA